MNQYSPCVVSVVMPVYNSERFVREAVESVIAQTFREWELIIVDDCSSDGTEAIISELATSDSRIRTIILSQNSGSPSHPRNVGIREAVGDYIAFLDSDDRWKSNKLEVQLYEMRMHGWPISCSGYDVIDENGLLQGFFKAPPSVSFSQLLRHNTLGCLTVMYNVKRLGKRYFPDCGHEDYALWLDIAESGVEIGGIDCQLAEYRQRSGSVSSNKLRILSYFWHIYRHRLGFGVIRSALHCCLYAYNARDKYSGR